MAGHLFGKKLARIEDPALQEKLADIVRIYLDDTWSARVLEAMGTADAAMALAGTGHGACDTKSTNSGGVRMRIDWIRSARAFAFVLGSSSLLAVAPALAELAAKRGLPIIGPHPGDQFWIDALPQQSRMFGFPPAEAFTPTRWLTDGDTVSVGGCTLEVRHCPGHTPGHVVFFEPSTRHAFVGDVLFAGSVGRERRSNPFVGGT